MFANNGRYVVIASGLAIVVTAVVQTVYTAATGRALSSTLPGLIVSCLLFMVIMLAVYAYFGRKGSASVDALVSLYDDACDPRAFVDGSAGYVEKMSAPYDAEASWFMSYYAQALLDLGEAKRAQQIEQNMYDSIKGAALLETQAKIVVNLVPLVVKLLGPADAVPVIQKGLDLLESGQCGRDAADFEAYLVNQLAVARAAASQDDVLLERFCFSTRRNEALPMRIRVEQAWEEAKIHYRKGDAAKEAECLDFVVRNGNKLALVKPASDRLLAIS